VLLVALDDANYLLYENELNKVLYTLLRAHESYEGVRIGVIVIISDPDVDLRGRWTPGSPRSSGPLRSISPRMGTQKCRRL
jgi:hypothetical protein